MILTQVRADSLSASTSQNMCIPISSVTPPTDSLSERGKSFWSSFEPSLPAIRPNHRHPRSLAFVQTPKPCPSSFARETYFGVTAMRFINQGGASRFGRYRVIPDAGNDHLDDAIAKSKDVNFLFDELAERIAKGPISFQLLVQAANDEDVADDATVHWPEERPQIPLGKILLTSLVPDNAHEQKKII